MAEIYYKNGTSFAKITAADVGASANEHTHNYAAASHNHSADNITSGTLPVGRGGTGATTFTSGAALIGNDTGAITTRAITNMTTKNYITYNTNLMTTNTLAYWNGAYSSAGESNLTYCNQGAFGTIVTKSTSDYATAGHTHSYLPLSGGTTTGSIWAGNSTATTSELDSGVRSGAGTIFMYSSGSSTGNRGLYGANNGGTSASILTVSSSNVVSLKGSATTLSSTLAVSKGGTGQTTLAAARNAMGLGNTTGAVPVANGGTGTTTVTGIANLVIKSGTAAAPASGTAGTIYVQYS